MSGAMSSRTGSDEEKLTKLKAEAKTHGFDKGHRDVSLEYVGWPLIASLITITHGFDKGHRDVSLEYVATVEDLPCLAGHCRGPAFGMQVLTTASCLPPLLPTGTLPSGQSP